MNDTQQHTLGLLLLGVLATVVLVGIVTGKTGSLHPIGYSDGTDGSEVHVHGDFLIHVNGHTLDLTDDRYQSTEHSTKHFHIHLHNNNGHVVHRHANDVTFAEFLSSLGFMLADDCLELDTGVRYCSDETNVLQLYVNGEVFPTPTEYEVNERDRILLYYGSDDPVTIATLLDRIPDDACIASGTCPERGEPMPEVCSGAKCEI